MIVLQTPRLNLRKMNLNDASFVIELLNSEKWIKYIGDFGVRSLDDAKLYLNQRVLPKYEALGFGFYLVQRKHDGAKIGNCGLTCRDGLEHADIGFSLLNEFEGQGYALEAATAVLDYGFSVHNLKHIEAIVDPENKRSQHLLKKLGMVFKDRVFLPDDEEELLLFGIGAPRGGKA